MFFMNQNFLKILAGAITWRDSLRRFEWIELTARLYEGSSDMSKQIMQALSIFCGVLFLQTKGKYLFSLYIMSSSIEFQVKWNVNK